ncbi:MAG: hypothetical protein J7L07_05845 [Candidatus Odinarchaeota archaeon]|nr:hypothetical protein [Candidatus Odinarchaeota archaeon]
MVTFPEGYNITLSFKNTNSQLSMGINKKKFFRFSRAKNNSLTLYCDAKCLLLKKPAVTVKGKVYIKKIQFDKPYSLKIPANRVPIFLYGNIYFKIKLSDQEEIYLSDLLFSGKVHAVHPDSETINRSVTTVGDLLKSRLPEILISPFHVALIILLPIITIKKHKNAKQPGTMPAKNSGTHRFDTTANVSNLRNKNYC